MALAVLGSVWVVSLLHIAHTRSATPRASVAFSEGKRRKGRLRRGAPLPKLTAVRLPPCCAVADSDSNAGAGKPANSDAAKGRLQSLLGEQLHSFADDCFQYTRDVEGALVIGMAMVGVRLATLQREAKLQHAAELWEVALQRAAERREVALQRVADLREGELKLTAEKEASALKQEVSALQLEAGRRQSDFKDKSTEMTVFQDDLTRSYLKVRGMFDMRGLLEYAEERMLEVLPPKGYRDKPEIYKEYMGQAVAQPLLACMTKTGWQRSAAKQDKQIMNYVEGQVVLHYAMCDTPRPSLCDTPKLFCKFMRLQSTLSGHIHGGKEQHGDRVKIVEGAVSAEQVRALDCIAAHFVPADIIWEKALSLPAPAAAPAAAAYAPADVPAAAADAPTVAASNDAAIAADAGNGDR
eukprot:jgi/Chlat1/5847/Chrsp4S06230